MLPSLFASERASATRGRTSGDYGIRVHLMRPATERANPHVDDRRPRPGRPVDYLAIVGIVVGIDMAPAGARRPSGRGRLGALFDSAQHCACLYEVS